MANLRHRGGGLAAGPGFPTRVNALIGTSSRGGLVAQNRKLESLLNAEHKPDIVSDLSIVALGEQALWRRIVAETPFVAASLPVYTVTIRQGRVDQRELLDIAIEHMEGGVGLLTIHPTASREIIELARRRTIPWTSRGGGVVIADLLVSEEAENVYLRILPDIIKAAAKTKTTLSIGATFRSATILDAFDHAQQSELRRQLEIAAQIEEQNVDVIIETPGHARPSHLRQIADVLRGAKLPVMPLGPLPTDAAIGQDHIAGAIGATLFGLAGCAHIIAAVTREEHTGGIPSEASTLEAVAAAKVAAHIIDVELLGNDLADRAVTRERAASRSCVVGTNQRGCARCASLCPL